MKKQSSKWDVENQCHLRINDWVTGNRCGRLNTGVTKEGGADNYKGEETNKDRK